MVELEINKRPGQNRDEKTNVSIDKARIDLKDKNHIHRSSYNNYSNIAFAVGLITCPCHLPITLPILSLVFSRFSITFFKIDNFGEILLFLTTIFVISILIGYFLKGRTKNLSYNDCKSCQLTQ